MPYVNPISKPNSVEVMHAKSIIAQINKASKSIMHSSIDRELKNTMIPTERAGGYIAHSIDVLIEAGFSDAEVLEMHSKMVQMITEIKRDTLHK